MVIQAKYQPNIGPSFNKTDRNERVKGHHHFYCCTCTSAQSKVGPQVCRSQLELAPYRKCMLLLSFRLWLQWMETVWIFAGWKRTEHRQRVKDTDRADSGCSHGLIHDTWGVCGWDCVAHLQSPLMNHRVIHIGQNVDVHKHAHRHGQMIKWMSCRPSWTLNYHLNFFKTC